MKLLKYFITIFILFVFLTLTEGRRRGGFGRSYGHRYSRGYSRTVITRSWGRASGYNRGFYGRPYYGYGGYRPYWPYRYFGK
uniref:Uncharacterized protein n=1 Tax=Strongyloides stercoralis TaxID=6248 RepID=A0A0K0E9A7_STRER